MPIKCIYGCMGCEECAKYCSCDVLRTGSDKAAMGQFSLKSHPLTDGLRNSQGKSGRIYHQMPSTDRGHLVKMLQIVIWL